MLHDGLELLGEAWAGRCPLAGTVCQQEQSDTLLLSATAGSAGLASGLVGTGWHYMTQGLGPHLQAQG